MDLLLTDPSGSEDEEYFSSSPLPYKYVEECCPSEDASPDDGQQLSEPEENLSEDVSTDVNPSFSEPKENCPSTDTAPDGGQSSSKTGGTDDDELRLLRRVQIEKQFASLGPSMHLQLLAHMPSFQKALQVAAPLNATEWDSLRFALIAEKEEAETKLKAANVLRTSGSPLDGFIKQKLRGYFFNYWVSRWGHAKLVPKKDHGPFVTGALSYARAAFYNEFESEGAKSSVPQKLLNPLAKPFLTLKYLKWFFEKVVTKHIKDSRDVFRCPKCPTSTKKRALSGFLDHYSSKHSLQFRSGASIVGMASEWPNGFVFCHGVPDCTDMDEVEGQARGVAFLLETLKIGLDKSSKTNSVVSPKSALKTAICSTATTVWSNLPNTTTNFVKTQILINQLVRRYNDGSQSITLDMFREVLKADCMAKIRTCNVIRCTFCHSYSKKLKRQPLGDVVEHFYDQHYDQQSLPKGQLDWRKDMIFVPPERLLEAWNRKSKSMPSLVRNMYLQAFPGLPTGQHVSSKSTATPTKLKATANSNSLFKALSSVAAVGPTLDTPAKLPVQQACSPSAADLSSLKPPTEMDKVKPTRSNSKLAPVEKGAIVPMKRSLENTEDSPASKRLKRRKKKRAAKAAQKTRTGDLNTSNAATDWERGTGTLENKKRPLEDAEESWLSSKRLRQESLPQSAPPPNKKYGYSALQRHAAQI